MLPSSRPRNRGPGSLGDAVYAVLEAERAALAEVENYKLQTLQMVDASRLRAEQLHQHTETRIERLHERMIAAAHDRQARLSREMASLARDTDGSLLAPLDHVIARVIEELVGIPESS